MKMGLRVSVLAAMLALFIVSDSQAEDKLTLVRDNTVVDGRIKKEDVDGIEFESKGGGAIIYKPAEIAKIEWHITEPPEFREAMRLFNAGDYDRAAEIFGGIVKDEDAMKAFRSEAKGYLSYLYAESLYRSEKAKEAMQEFTKFMAGYSTSSYTGVAVASMVDCAIQSGDFGSVPPLLSKLRQQGGDQPALADYLEGKMLLAQGKVREAGQRFNKAAAAASSLTTRGLALMGQASVAVQEKDLAKARDLAQRALAANPPRGVAAAAHIVIGDAILAEIDAKNPVGEELVNAYLDAVLSYMRVPLLYGGDRATESKALFQAGEIFKRMSKLPNHGSDRMRAVTLLTRLTQDSRYRGSEYVAKAAASLKSFR